MLHPPVSVAVADPAHELPSAPGRWAYEPKLDGYRVIGFAARGLLQSRQGNTSMTTRFPEVTAEIARCGDVVLDGELVALHGMRLAFSALQSGPAKRRRDGVTAVFMAFDLLAAGDRDLRTQSYLDRRAALATLLAGHQAHLQLTEYTLDADAAREWLRPGWGEAGVEGVVAKPRASRYARRCGWLKVRRRHTTEAVVLGVAESNALILGTPNHAGQWRVTGVSLPVPEQLRAELAARLRADPDQLDPVQLPGIVGGLPGDSEIIYQPVQAVLVVEIEVDTAVEFGRHRHRPRVLRIRDDLTAGDL